MHIALCQMIVGLIWNCCRTEKVISVTASGPNGYRSGTETVIQYSEESCVRKLGDYWFMVYSVKRSTSQNLLTCRLFDLYTF